MTVPGRSCDYCNVRIRTLKASDIPILGAMAEASKFPYPDLNHPHIEAVLVITDDADRPIMACAAKRLIELYLYVDPACSPAVKMAALNTLHKGMSAVLREIKYNSVECYLPEQIAAKFGRRLERTWGWVKNWPSWCVRF